MKYIHGRSLIKIAIVDDHVLLRQALCQTINSWHNCKVLFDSTDGEEFIDLLKNDDLPDLLIIDLELPKLNGYDTLKQIRINLPDMKACAFSFYNSNETINRVFKAGFNGFVDKSDDVSVLKSAINEIMKSGYFYTDKSVLKTLIQNRITESAITKFFFSDEELLFLKLIASDKTYKEIARDMNTNERHIDYLRGTFFELYEINSRTALAVIALRHGLLI